MHSGRAQGKQTSSTDFKDVQISVFGTSSTYDRNASFLKEPPKPNSEILKYVVQLTENLRSKQRGTCLPT